AVGGAAFEEVAQSNSVFTGIAASDDAQGSALQAGVLGAHYELGDFAIRQSNGEGFAVQRNLVEPRTVDNQRLRDSHRVESLGNAAQHSGVGDAQQLHRRPGRVD